MSRTKRSLILLASVLVHLMVATPFMACGSESGREEMRAEETTLESAGRDATVTFPASAKLLGVHRERGIDPLIAIKVEMPAQDWPSFLAELPVDPTLFLPGERGLLGPDDDFWDPGKAKNLRTVQGNLPGSKVLNIGYDDSKTGMVVVYVVNHGL